MNTKRFYLAAWTVGVVFLAAAALAAGPAAEGAPSADLPERHFSFEPVVDGTEVVHNFVLYNKGSASLKIQKVRTG